MLSRLLAAVAFIAASSVPAIAHAATAVVSVPTPAGVYAPLDITLDGPGVIRINSAALDTSGHYVFSGPCVLDRGAGFNGVAGPYIGATCTGAGSVHFRTTGQLTSTCAYDGAILEGLHLTVKVDGVVVYDEQLWPNPVVCYVTLARQATATFNNDTGVLRFDNSTQARPSATTTYTLADPAWLYTAHTFSVPAGITCSAYSVRVGTRYIYHYEQRGFQCSGVVPASTILVLTVT
jgi:hypothetical protein